MLYREKGFTLIELMVALAIVAILAAVAIPTYTEFVDQGRRSDAISELLNIQRLQEKWRASNTSYGSASQLGVGSSSSQGFYTLSISNLSATSYRVSAAPTGAQASDSCGTFVLTQAGPVYNLGTGYADASCWGL